MRAGAEPEAVAVLLRGQHDDADAAGVREHGLRRLLQHAAVRRRPRDAAWRWPPDPPRGQPQPALRRLPQHATSPTRRGSWRPTPAPPA